MASILSSGPTGLILPGKAVRVPQSQLAVPNGLVGYWPLSYESINLAAAKAENYAPGLPLTLSGVTGTNLRDTATGGGIAFDGSTNLADAAVPTISDYSAPFSFACWVNAATLVGVQVFLATGDSGGSGAYLAYRDDISGGTFVFNADGSGNYAFSNVTPSTGRLYFLAGVVYNGPVVTLFVDAIRQTATSSSAGGGGAALTHTAIAASASGGGKATATISECRIYNRALDAAEVMELYQTGLSGRRDKMVGPTQFSELPSLPPTTLFQASGVVGGSRPNWKFLPRIPGRLPDGVTRGLSGRWPLDAPSRDNAWRDLQGGLPLYDDMGGGTPVPTPFAPGVTTGQAAGFVAASNNNELNWGANPLGVSAASWTGSMFYWIWLDQYASGDGNDPRHAIFSSDIFAASDFSNGRYNVRAGGGGGTEVSSTNFIPLSKWSQVGFTWDGSALSLYINGGKETNTAALGNSGNLGAYSIGGRASGLIGSGANRTLGGRMQDFRIYTGTVLTPAEVQELYLSAFAPDETLPQLANPVVQASGSGFGRPYRGPIFPYRSPRQIPT